MRRLAQAIGTTHAIDSAELLRGVLRLLRDGEALELLKEDEMRRRDRYPLGVTMDYPPLVEKGDGRGRHHLVTGYVYFARHHPNGHYIKIGWAVDPTIRLRTWLLEILAAVPGSRNDEDDIQDMFMHLHYEGEWFEPGDDLLDYIAGLADA